MSSQKRQIRRKKKSLCLLEPLFLKVREALMYDLADENLQRLYSMKERGFDYMPLNDGAPPYLFKKVQQLMHFDKRVIWSTDESFENISTSSLIGWMESQEEFICPEPMSLRATLVIDKAREICASILGEFDWDECLDSCSFGKRAAMGLKQTECYLDNRFSKLSGSAMQVAAFNHALSRDVHLFRAVRERIDKLKTIQFIKAAAVPKSWKSARIMFPDSVLGGFLSRGVGGLIRRRLEKNTNIDLSKQQERHRRWAREASINGLKSTIDMRKASDSFVRRHIELVVPESWHHILDILHFDQVEIGGKLVECRSFMLMGSGHTFPLQTLLFYCLAEATRTLLKCRGKASVYGDDIIVPTKIAGHFIVIMSELGFQINSAKSFYDAPDPDRPSHTFFRESCGGDYKGGVDVRPYMPECDLQENSEVPRAEKLAWCHKLINGLLERWSAYELPITLGLLLHEINSMGYPVCFVPSWETDHAGIKHYLPPHLTFNLECSGISYDRCTPTYKRLVFRQRKRPRNTKERPYVWYKYWLKRNPSRFNFFNWLTEGITSFSEANEKNLYDEPISLSGEPNRRLRGWYSLQVFHSWSEKVGQQQK